MWRVYWTWMTCLCNERISVRRQDIFLWWPLCEKIHGGAYTHIYGIQWTKLISYIYTHTCHIHNGWRAYKCTQIYISGQRVELGLGRVFLTSVLLLTNFSKSGSTLSSNIWTRRRKILAFEGFASLSGPGPLISGPIDKPTCRFQNLGMTSPKYTQPKFPPLIIRAMHIWVSPGPICTSNFAFCFLFIYSS